MGGGHRSRLDCTEGGLILELFTARCFMLYYDQSYIIQLQQASTVR